MTPSRYEIKKSDIDMTAAKWSKASLTVPARTQNHDCAPRRLVKCDNALAGRHHLSGWIKDDGGQMSSTELCLVLG